jgi:RNA polymerase sigma factor (sigma-70 family)
MRTPLLYFNDDAKILDALRQGNEDALAELFHKNRRPITALVIRNKGTEDDAEDILQEALVVLWERIRSNSFEYQAKLSTFLYATAKNIWLRRLVRMRREIPATEETANIPTDALTPLESAEENERTAAIRTAMERLGNPCRDLLLLYYWEERSMEEIAGQLGFANADTVKSKKYQCKKALEHLLKAALGGNRL